MWKEDEKKQVVSQRGHFDWFSNTRVCIYFIYKILTSILEQVKLVYSKSGMFRFLLHVPWYD